MFHNIIMGETRETDENPETNQFMDAYEQKENEILEERLKLFKEYENIQNLDGKEEYLEIDMNRYKMYYLGWSMGVLVLALFSIKLFK
jgi:hypothetical protein